MFEEKFKNSFFIKLLFSMKMAFHGLALNPLRTTLTVLGVTIGVASVVSLMGIGEGARIAVMEQFESLGTNVIKLSASNPAYEFDSELSDDLVVRVQGLDYISPLVHADTQLKWKRSRIDVEVIGVNEQFDSIRDHVIADGVFLSQYQVKLRANVAVVGYNIGNNLMNGRSPVGRYITLDGENYEIIGVLGEKGKGKADGIDDKIIIPFTCAQKIVGKRTVEEIWGKASSKDDARLAVVQLGRIIRKKLNIKDGVPAAPTNDNNNGFEGEVMFDNFGGGFIDSGGGGGGNTPAPKTGEDIITITNLNQMVEEADEANRVMSLLLGGIAAVSLLVGGLGIMNIMLVAVAERTEEIGLRRALGAQKNDLLMQFLLEALFVSILGSIVGVVLGIGGTAIFENYGFDTAISFKAIYIATMVAVSSGMIFGVYPAFTAASIPPVVALRRQ